MGDSVQSFDVAIVGFGFSGLATLINLARSSSHLNIAVIAPDDSGHGQAYRTRDPSHLLNVMAERMGAWADDEQDFLFWLRTPSAVAASRELGHSPPGPDDFAPRALFARYLTELRAGALAQIDKRRGTLSWIRECAVSIIREDGGWLIVTPTREVRARSCVLAVGNDPRHVFGDLRHPALHDGPWELGPSDIPRDGGPVALIGSGLTAVDAVLSLRGLGYTGDVLALSRHGLLPQAHDHELRALEVAPEALRHVRTLSDVVRFASDRRAAGSDWREIIDGLRPYTVELWQGLSAADQRTAIDRWASTWNVYRHRMAPEVAKRIAGELESGSLRVLAARRISPEATGDRLRLEFETSGGVIQEAVAAAVIDCTGPQLDPGRSEQPLLRGLVQSGICARHRTGLGLTAGGDQQVAPDLYMIGSLLTGQLWETIAVPELREQAALIADAVRRSSSPGGAQRFRGAA